MRTAECGVRSAVLFAESSAECRRQELAELIVLALRQEYPGRWPLKSYGGGCSSVVSAATSRTSSPTRQFRPPRSQVPQYSTMMRVESRLGIV